MDERVGMLSRTFSALTCVALPLLGTACGAGGDAQLRADIRSASPGAANSTSVTSSVSSGVAVGPVVPTTFSTTSTPRKVPGAAVRFEPPQSGQAPRVAMSTAFLVCTGPQHAAPCEGGQPMAEFSVFSDDVFGNPASSPYPRFQRVPAWLFTWRGVPCAPAGPGAPAGTTPQPAAQYTCEHVVIVSADTGTYLLALDQGSPTT